MVEDMVLRGWAEDLIGAAVLAALDALDTCCKEPHSAKRLHAARKQLARLQATLQDFASLVSGAEDLLERVHELHRDSGEIRDSDVLLDRLREYATLRARSQARQIDRLRCELRKRRRAGRRKLRAAIAKADLKLKE